MSAHYTHTHLPCGRAFLHWPLYRPSLNSGWELNLYSMLSLCRNSSSLVSRLRSLCVHKWLLHNDYIIGRYVSMVTACMLTHPLPQTNCCRLKVIPMASVSALSHLDCMGEEVITSWWCNACHVHYIASTLWDSSLHCSSMDPSGKINRKELL